MTRFHNFLAKIEREISGGSLDFEDKRSVSWFLEFIDQTESADEVNAYVEALDAENVHLISTESTDGCHAK